MTQIPDLNPSMELTITPPRALEDAGLHALQRLRLGTLRGAPCVPGITQGLGLSRQRLGMLLLRLVQLVCSPSLRQPRFGQTCYGGPAGC